MIKIEKRELDDLTSEEVEALEEKHVDVVCEILDGFRKEIQRTPENPGWALDSAIEDAKLSDEDKALLLPFKANAKLKESFDNLTRLYMGYARDTHPVDQTPKAVEKTISYAMGARHLSKTCAIPMGDFLVDQVDGTRVDELDDIVRNMVLDCCFKEIDKDKVDAYLLDAGKAILSAGIKSMKSHPNYNAFIEEGKRFNQAEEAFKPADLSV